jgi:hypothetical protein
MRLRKVLNVTLNHILYYLSDNNSHIKQYHVVILKKKKKKKKTNNKQYHVVKCHIQNFMKLRINTIRIGCKIPPLHLLIRQNHVTFIHFISRLKMSSPTQNHYS